MAAGAISTLRSSVPFVAAVENLRPAQGGVDGETLDEARDRGSILLRTRSRAVTAEDYEVLSRQAAPEAARIRCVTAGRRTRGAAQGAGRARRPPWRSGRIEFADLVPAEDTLARLADRLDEVRLIGTRVLSSRRATEGSRWSRGWCRAEDEPGQGAAGRAARVVRVPQPAARRRPGPPGWPFGRPVRTGDVYGVLQRVRGIESVEDVRLFTRQSADR